MPTAKYFYGYVWLHVCVISVHLMQTVTSALRHTQPSSLFVNPRRKFTDGSTNQLTISKRQQTHVLISDLTIYLLICPSHKHVWCELSLYYSSENNPAFNICVRYKLIHLVGYPWTFSLKYYNGWIIWEVRQIRRC